MIYLLIAVCCSVAVSVLLKILRQRHIDIRQTIVVGYPVAFILTGLLLKPNLAGISDLNTASWSIIVALGVLLPLIFVILGKSIEAVGIIATDAAQRLSLVIPIVASFLFFGEVLSTQRVVGIILAFLALGALMYRTDKALPTELSTESVPLNNEQSVSSASSSISSPNISAKNIWLWLSAVWLGYGLIDILFKQVAKQGAAFSLTLFMSFGLAAILLFIYLLVKQTKWHVNAMSSGLILGVLNMGNIYAYVKAHQTLSESPSIVFTGMNIGVIAVASLIGVSIFKEYLSKINMLGIVLAICSVLVLFVKF